MIKSLFDSIRDMIPIIIVIAFFQIIVLQQPFPNPWEILIGLFAVILGLTLFVKGLNLSLFPVGEGLAEAFAKRNSVFWLILSALGFGTTVTEPALIVVSAEAAKVTAIANRTYSSSQAQHGYANGLRAG